MVDFFTATKHFLPNLRAQRRRGFVYSFFWILFGPDLVWPGPTRSGPAQFGSVQFACVAIVGFCVCTADHTSVIFPIIIIINKVVVFLL